MRALTAATIGAYLVLLAGCTSTQEWKSRPEVATAENDYFSLHASPVCRAQRIFVNAAEQGGCEAILLKLTNKSDKKLEIDWDNTVYLLAGEPLGGFMFEGIPFSGRNEPRAPEVVPPNGSLIREIYPNVLVSRGSSGRFRHEWLPLGQNGLVLATVVDGRATNARAVFQLTSSPDVYE